MFSVRDEHANVFKVVLGNPHSCTCSDSLSTGDLCLHQLYCLVKVLRVPESHPLSYQLGITDTEADMILSGQCCDAGGAKNGRGVENLSAMARAKRLAKQKGKKGGSEEVDGAAEARANGWVERQVLGEGDDENCAICQDFMDKDQALTWCRKGCGNNMHAKCMQTFAQYKITSRQSVACPLCREEWNIELLKDDLRGKAALKNSCAPIYCSSCTHSLRSGPFYRCLECTQKRVQAPSVATSHGDSSALAIGGESLEVKNDETSGLGLVDTSGKWRTPPEISRGAASAGSHSNNGSSKPVTPSSSLGTKRAVDFCESCFQRLGREHVTHHFLCSEANGDLAAAESAGGDAEDYWTVAANPLHLLRGRGMEGNRSGSGGSRGSHTLSGAVGAQRGGTPGQDDLLTEALASLESREITMDDYELLLELDRTPNSSVSAQLCMALPKYRGPAAAGHVLAPPGSVITDELRETCWCCQDGGDRSISPQIAQSPVHALPCGHVAHEWCLSTAIDRAHVQEGTPFSRWRCPHEDCSQIVFQCLNRRRRKPGSSKAGSSRKTLKNSRGGAKDKAGADRCDEAIEQPPLGAGLFAAGTGLASRAVRGVVDFGESVYPSSLAGSASVGSLSSLQGTSTMPSAPIGIGSTELSHAYNAPRPAPLLGSTTGSIPPARPVSPLQVVETIQGTRDATGAGALPQLSGSQVTRGFRHTQQHLGGIAMGAQAKRRSGGKLLKGGTLRPQGAADLRLQQDSIHAHSSSATELSLAATTTDRATVGRSPSAEVVTLEGGVRGKGGSSTQLHRSGPVGIRRSTRTGVNLIPMVEQDNSVHRAYSPMTQAPTRLEASGDIPGAANGCSGDSRENTAALELRAKKAEDDRKEGNESSSARVRRERKAKFGSVAKSSLASGPLELSGVSKSGSMGGVSAPVSVTSLASLEGMTADREQHGRGRTKPAKGALAAIGKKKKEAIAGLQVGVREGAGAVVPLRGFRTGLREGATPDLHLQPGVGTHRSLATDRLIASELRTLL